MLKAMTLFQTDNNPRTLPPLAERLRPKTLDEFLGQNHLLAEDRLVRRLLENGELFSLILWGPPGCGKTTLAKLLSQQADAAFYEVSAVSAGVKDVRETLARARSNREMGQASILFIDEIHRFNKAQQDALLQAVENGIITLIGATTENPSFEVISPLLSRSQVLKLQPLSVEALSSILDRALKTDLFLSTQDIVLTRDARAMLLEAVAGDARKLLNALQITVSLTREDESGVRTVTPQLVKEALQQKNTLYDKAGDYHYDTISAFIKSVRGSDPDAALYWLAVMIEGGEDPVFIARRLIILASEDVGNADPRALPLATAALQAIQAIGMPEGAIVLGQATTYLASTSKSNASYKAIRSAQQSVQENGARPVPLHLRNAPTDLMKEQGYGEGYLYPHDHTGHFVETQYLPDDLKGKTFYHPSQEGAESRIYQRLKNLWPGRHRNEADH